MRRSEDVVTEGQRPDELNRYRRPIQQQILCHPDRLVFSLTFDQQKVWIKRRPEPKKLFWHRLQKILAVVLHAPLLRPTVSTGGAESLRHEADRLARLRAHGIPVPDVILCEPDFLVTEDCGAPLDVWLWTLPTIQERRVWLERALQLLLRVHAVGMVHGRPMLRDMLIEEGELTLIDLEEDPTQFMPLAHAQARDLWLFMVGVAPLLANEMEAAKVLAQWRDSICSETQRVLRRLVKTLRPFSWTLDKTLARHLGRDLQRAVLANNAMTRALR
ncbi:MAG: hypothetical protein EA424_10440 [Planctomycetaceae bacterium]|nr:MAG: hypothetical protein EA424_10440 [Planctomycetaceae bacterium]